VIQASKHVQDNAHYNSLLPCISQTLSNTTQRSYQAGQDAIYFHAAEKKPGMTCWSARCCVLPGDLISWLPKICQLPERVRPTCLA